VFDWVKKTVKGAREEDLPEPNAGLPDSDRPSGLCPRCGKQSSFEVAGSLPVTFDSSYMLNHDGSQERTIIDRVSSLVCRHCKQGVVVVEEEWVGDAPKKKGGRSGLVSYRGIHWWPLPNSTPSKDVPHQVGSAFAEAVDALAAHCPRASAVMARATLEAVTADKGQTSGKLFERLAALAAQGILQPTLAGWAKEVRLIGNLGVHVDPTQAVSEGDAGQLVSFIRELLRYLYELPAELERRRST
jgi:hypothetical protein